METEALDNRFHKLLDYSRNSGKISVEAYLELVRTYEKFGPEQAMDELHSLLRSNWEITRQPLPDERLLMFSMIGLIISVVLIAIVYVWKG